MGKNAIRNLVGKKDNGDGCERLNGQDGNGGKK